MLYQYKPRTHSCGTRLYKVGYALGARMAHSYKRVRFPIYYCPKCAVKFHILETGINDVKLYLIEENPIESYHGVFEYENESVIKENIKKVKNRKYTTEW